MIDFQIVNSARHRRAKTDAIHGETLLRTLMAQGENRHGKPGLQHTRFVWLRTKCEAHDRKRVGQAATNLRRCNRGTGQFVAHLAQTAAALTISRVKRRLSEASNLDRLCDAVSRKPIDPSAVLVVPMGVGLEATPKSR